MLALGGGVVGDMTGFAAATWLQASGDSGANDAAGDGGCGHRRENRCQPSRRKNLIGAFHQPRLVLIDPRTLSTLPAREFRAGMAEVIKYGILGDAELFGAWKRLQGPLHRSRV